MPSSRRRKTQKNNRPRLKFYEVTAILIFLALSCFLTFLITAGLFASNDLSPAYAYARQTQQAMNATPTATPFQPIEMVNEPNQPQADIPDINLEITPEPPPEKADPEPAATTRVLQKPEGQVNILLLGSDARPDEGGFRTDVIVWVSLNPKQDFVSAISFPRDLYVNIPGLGYNRINVAFPYGGFELLADTLDLNFGVRPDMYVLVDFNGFRTVIDDLGGIDVQVAQNLSDSCATWINSSGWCSVGPGLMHMNADVALWYARSRYSTNDIDRARRAQEIVKGVFNRLISLDVILKAPDLYKAYVTYVDTDIKLVDVVALLPLASKVNDNGDIRNYVIGYDHAYDWITSGGAQVLIPDYGAIQELLTEALALE
jgi:LCP family protein required for cell wall assembly